MLNLSVVWSIAKRDFVRYFSNPAGYVFITLFIFMSATAAFWTPRFFLDNLANLDELNAVFPVLLVFFVATLTMGVWSEERKQGTDELLLTLPASDAEIVLGKYLSVLGVYTVAVAMSLSHAAVLEWLGSPDRGLLAVNYIGYWLAGAALIAVGLLASVGTANTTVAFILATALCSAPVAIDSIVGAFNEVVGRRIVPFGVFSHFADFAAGVLSVSALLYFLSLMGFALFATSLVVGRRRWPPANRGLSMGSHRAVRAIALAIALVAVNVAVARARWRIDLTAERLHTLGAETRRLIQTIPSERAIRIQAFVSPDVPTEYVQERENLLNALRDIAAVGGSKVDLAVQDTDPYSDAARTARERFGIVPRLVVDPSSAGTDRQAVFLGVAVTSGSDELVIPFFEHGVSAEYEVTRAIRSVARAVRKRVGIVDTDANVSGGVDFESGRTRVRWAIIEELRRQYELVPITPYEPIREPLDALLVVLPSTLLQREMDNVFDAIRRGVPTLVIVDPVPAIDMRLAPAAPMAASVNPFRPADQAYARKNTGDITSAMRSIGIDWPPTRIAWDGYRPHPELAELPWEVLFVGKGNGNPMAFNPAHPASSGLQELIMMYAGSLAPVADSGLTFEPLVQTGPVSGTESYFQLVQPSPSGSVLNVAMPHQAEGRPLTLAAQVRSKTIDAIVVADLDFISDQFFDMRSRADADVTADNVTFLLNCIDVLAKDESFVALRKRRLQYRTLERVEAETRAYIERRGKEEQQAAAEAKATIDHAQQTFAKTVADIDRRTDLDAQAREIMARNLQETENHRLDLMRRNIELARDAAIETSREKMEQGVRHIRNTIRTIAVLSPPLPIFVVGVAIFFSRRRRERETTAPRRWAH